MTFLPPGKTIPRRRPRQATEAPKYDPRPPRKSTRFSTYNEMVDNTMRDLTGAEFKVWSVLWRDVKRGVARTAESDIAKRTGYSLRYVEKIIRKLKAGGYIVVDKEGNLWAGPSTYKVLSKPSLPELQDGQLPVQ